MFRPISRADLNLRHRPHERPVAHCVITTLDDQVLLRTAEAPLTIPRHHIRNIITAEQELAAVFDTMSSLRAVGTTTLQNLVDVSFLGHYFRVPPKCAKVVLPFAIELDMEAGELEVQRPTICWTSFDEAEERLARTDLLNSTHPDEPYCASALQVYFDKMTVVEEGH